MQRRIGVYLIAIVLTLQLVFTSSQYAYARNLRFISVQNQSILDTNGQQILLRGVNYPGYECSNDPKSHTESNYRQFAKSGFNVVRLPISWNLLEPSPGFFDISYVHGYLENDIRWAKEYGLYVILDMHQWKWAEKFGGCGAPSWAVQNYPSTSSGMMAFVDDFWTKSNLQSHLIKTWVKLATMFANDTNVAGYDILNEPWVYVKPRSSSPNATSVEVFYLHVLNAIRAVDHNHIIFLEPSNLSPIFSPLFRNNNIVWSPHFYPLSFASTYHPEDVTLLRADLVAKYEMFVNKSGTPMWIGEFGAFMKDDSYKVWLQNAVVLFDQYHLGWAWWAYGDDGKVGPPSIPSSIMLSSGP